MPRILLRICKTWPCFYSGISFRWDRMPRWSHCYAGVSRVSGNALHEAHSMGEEYSFCYVVCMVLGRKEKVAEKHGAMARFSYFVRVHCEDRLSYTTALPHCCGLTVWLNTGQSCGLFWTGKCCRLNSVCFAIGCASRYEFVCVRLCVWLCV